MTFDELQDVVVSLHEFNPMMGHRGCRLCVTYPEIAEMQTNAVIKAALQGQRRDRHDDHAVHHDPAGRRAQGAQVHQGHRCPHGGRAHQKMPVWI